MFENTKHQDCLEIYNGTFDILDKVTNAYHCFI